MPTCDNAGQATAHWQVGVATVDITPADGEPIGCFPNRTPTMSPRKAQGARDRLEASALAIGEGDNGVIILAADVPMFRRDQCEAVRAMVANAEPRIAVDQIVFAASHTHHGLDNTYLFGIEPGYPAINTMLQQLADVVVRAWRDREPASLHAGMATANLSHNRRVKDENGKMQMVFDRQEGVTTGPVDPQVPVWLFRKADQSPKAALFQLTAHPLAIGPGNQLFTADYPGVARTILRSAMPGLTPIFVNGAAGDVHPYRSMKPDFEAVDLVGTQLGETVDGALSNPDSRILQDEPAQPIRFASRELTFANRADASLEVKVKVSCARIGDWLLAVVPGEYFVSYQLRLKEALAERQVMLIGYADGWPGYIPTREAYDEGGYGVDFCAADPPAYCRTALPIGAGETIYETLLELAGEVG